MSISIRQAVCCNGAFGGILVLWLRERCPANFRDLLPHRNIAFIADLDSFCYRQNSRAFTEEHLSYETRSQKFYDNSISHASA